MKNKRFILGFISILTLSFLGAFVSADATYASCYDGNGKFFTNSGTIYSSFNEIGGLDPNTDAGVNWACDNPSEARALLFFAEHDNATSKRGNKYYFNVNIAIGHSTQEKVDLIGIVHNGGGEAADINLCASRHCYSGGHDSAVFGPRPNPYTTLSRGHAASGYGGWTIPDGSRITVTINGAELYRRVKSNEVEYTLDQTNGVYRILISNWRCYRSPGSGCLDSPMYITMRADQKAMFTGSTDVSTHSIQADNGNYNVTFTHTVRRTQGNNFSVYNNCTTNIEQNSGILYAANKGGTKKNCSYTSNNVGDQKVVKDDISGYIYPGQTITICESMSYQSEVHTFETSKNKTSTTNKQCVTITRGEASCSAIGGTYTHAGGTNIGRIGVKNSSKGATTSYSPTTGFSRRNNTQYADDVYAKPGDSIQFVYDMCAGAELANKLNFDPKIYVAYTPRADSTSRNNNNNYLFGNALKNWNNNATSGFLGDTYEHKVTSPSNSGTDFKCNTYNRVTNNYFSNHYQIPGLTSKPVSSDDCSSASNVANTTYTDVGSIISQSLTWTDLTIRNRTNESSNGNYTAVARVLIPYNYKIKVTASETDNSIRNVTAGSTVRLNMNLDVLKRKNNKVQSAEYATHTKPTTYHIYQWYENSSTSIAQIKNKLGTPISGGGGYYNTRDINNIGYNNYAIVDSGAGKLIADKIHNIETNIQVDDRISIGTKVCVAASVFPADSHNSPNTADAGSLSQDVALSDGTAGAYYYVSEPSCYTISKKPSFVVKGSGFYAHNGTESALTRRTIGGQFYGFSSWAEYTITSSKNIVGVTSGASRWGGTKESNVSGNRTCYFSSLTIANDECRSNKLGEATILNEGASSPQSLKDQMMTRYVAKTNSQGRPVTDYKGKTVDLGGVCEYNAHDGRYVAPAGAKFDCLANGTKITYSSGDLTISGGSTLMNYCMSPALTDYDSRTSVIYVEGKLTIDANFYYGEKTRNDCRYHDQLYTSMHAMSQQIIIAKKVVFKERVTHYDGWVIADQIDTCDIKPFTKNNSINVNECNEQLVINGPVLTKYLNLYRTQGGGSNWSSRNIADNNNNNKAIIASPAEIFNIGPETYLWSQQQASRYSQAFTTYQRELPVRY